MDMLVKMRENKGFTLVELMIVVAIIGILAAVAVPFYQKYIQKSRLSSLVMPGIHSIETNIATKWSLQSTWPTYDEVNGDADTTYFDGTFTTTDPKKPYLTITLKNPDSSNPKFSQALLGNTKLVLTAIVGSNSTITKWQMSGGIADELGITDTEGN
jgi:type IV pilus assembly protein PilA